MDSDTTKRSIAQVIFRHTPASLVSIEERDMIGAITELKGEDDGEVNKNLLHERVMTFAKKWREDSEGRVKGFDDYILPDALRPIKPIKGVQWDIFPTIFECRNRECRIIIDSKDPNFTGKCHRCNSGLKQFRFVWYHVCGLLRTFKPIEQISCKNPAHGKKFLYLQDAYRFKSSRWRCRECSYQAAIGMLPCPDPLCKKLQNQNGKEKYLQASKWDDNWVYFTQVISFVNLKDQQIRPIIDSTRKNELMISALVGTVRAGMKRLAQKAMEEFDTRLCSNCRKEISVKDKFCKLCGTEQKILSDRNTGGETDKYTPDMFAENSEVATFTILRDLERTTSLLDLTDHDEIQKSIEYKFNIENSIKILNKIGISDLLLLQNFPLTYAAIGYSRYLSKPPSWLKSFPSISVNDTKIPIYTNCVTTEAWMLQLNATHLLSWLRTNNLWVEKYDIKETDKLNESELKLWFIDILTKESSEDVKDGLYVLVKELIHTYSHVLLQSLSIESGFDIASFGELLLPTTLSFIVFSGESELGGLTASFSQNLSSVLESLGENLRECKFDPSCSHDDDGACVGCIHLPRGCVQFNSGLSRAYLFGGLTKKLAANKIDVGFLDLR